MATTTLGIETPESGDTWNLIGDLNTIATQTDALIRQDRLSIAATNASLNALNKRILTGIYTFASIPGGERDTANISFPSGRFTKTPRVIVNASTAFPAERQGSATGVTTTGFTLNYDNSRGAASGLTMTWIAIQPE